MKVIISFVLLFVLVSCHEDPTYRDLAGNVMFSYLRQVHKEKGLVCAGFTSVVVPDIREFRMNYRLNKLNYNQSEARQLIVAVAEGFLKKVNLDVKIRPCLHEFPVTYKNLSLRIVFKTAQLERPSEQYVAYVLLQRGKIYFCNYNHDTEMLCDLGEEFYEDALELCGFNSCKNVVVGADL
ncbi:MAG: hypothetical protein V4494_01455 [Chlamydiota bacterium]